MDDVITLAPHTALTHLEEVNTYENALFWLQLNIRPFVTCVQTHWPCVWDVQQNFQLLHNS